MWAVGWSSTEGGKGQWESIQSLWNYNFKYQVGIWTGHSLLCDAKKATCPDQSGQCVASIWFSSPHRNLPAVTTEPLGSRKWNIWKKNKTDFSK